MPVVRACAEDSWTGMRSGEGGAEAFAHVDDGVEEDADLEPADGVQGGPGIVDAAEEGDGDDDHAEDEADLLAV